ncbi:MAG: hypothetical protein ACJ8FN_08290 [Sphingomicrobium sp.]
MSEFEFLFGLFGLLLGFILVEVLKGLVRTFRARLPSGPGLKPDIRLGWLTPMLAAFTMLNVTSFWAIFWTMQKTITLGYDTMLGGVILCSFYFFAASMIFPDEPRAWPDLDEWFWLHRRQVLGCILAANIPWLAASTLVDRGDPNLLIVDGVVTTLLAASFLLAILAKRRWIVTTGLALLVGTHISFIPMEMLRRYGFW